MTSKMSMPMRVNTSLSSLTSAMFTARNTFSTNLTASAVCVDETSTTRLTTRPIERRRQLRRQRAVATNDFRNGMRSEIGVARVFALRRECEEEIDA